MADFTKATGQLMDWTLLDDTGAIQVQESGELDVSTDIETVLHIDICHANNAAAAEGSLEVNVLVQSGSSDEDWHTLQRIGSGDGSTTDGTTGAITAGDSTISANDGTDWTIGERIFIFDGTIADSEICFIKNISTNNVLPIDNIVNSHASGTDLFDVVDQFNVTIPSSVSTCKVYFNNTDADANYALRIRFTKATDIA